MRLLPVKYIHAPLPSAAQCQCTFSTVVDILSEVTHVLKLGFKTANPTMPLDTEKLLADERQNGNCKSSVCFTLSNGSRAICRGTRHQ